MFRSNPKPMTKINNLHRPKPTNKINNLHGNEMYWFAVTKFVGEKICLQNLGRYDIF